MIELSLLGIFVFLIIAISSAHMAAEAPPVILWRGMINLWGFLMCTSACLFVISFGLFGYGVVQKSGERKLESDRVEAAWVAAQCPVYKSECGSKHKYACEHKAAVVGRNRVGDIFVEAHATCGEK